MKIWSNDVHKRFDQFAALASLGTCVCKPVKGLTEQYFPCLSTKRFGWGKQHRLKSQLKNVFWLQRKELTISPNFRKICWGISIWLESDRSAPMNEADLQRSASLNDLKHGQPAR